MIEWGCGLMETHVPAKRSATQMMADLILILEGLLNE